MGALNFLFRALRRGGGTAATTAVSPPPATSPRLMTPAERERLLQDIRPQELRYGDWHGGSSSWIAALRYNPIAGFGQMKVKRGGKVYTFARMAFAIFKEWHDAGSWGGYFNAYLKGRYTRF